MLGFKSLINMKRFLLVFFALLGLLPASLYSQNGFRLEFKNGSHYEFGFDNDPVMSVTENEIVVSVKFSYGSYTYSYSLENVEKFTFITASQYYPINPPTPPTEVEEVTVEEKVPTFYIEENTINIVDAKAEMPVSVYASDGKMLNVYKTDDDGRVSFSIEEYPTGTYIIKSQDISFKILKK